MVLDKLTTKAGAVLKALPKGKKRIPISIFIDTVIGVGGLGSFLIQSVPLTFKSNKTVSLDHLVKEAYYQAVKLEHPYVGTEHLVLALLKLSKSPEYNKIRLELLKYNVFSPTPKSYDFTTNTPLISQFGTNLSYKALRNLDEVIVERSVYRDLLSALLLKDSCGVILVGDRGVGRGTLINLFARKTSSFDVPLPLIGYKLIEIDFLNFMTSNLTKSGLDTSISMLVEELGNLGKVTVVLKNFENMFLSTSAGLSIPLAYTLFKSMLADAGIKILVKMDIDLYEKVSSEQDSVLDGFAIIDILEPSEKEILEILKSARDHLEDFHKVIISDEVIHYAYEKSSEHLLEFSYPKRVILVLDAACTQLILKKSRLPREYRTLVDKSFDLLTSIDTYVDVGNFDEATKKRIELEKAEGILGGMEEKVFLNTKRLILSKSDLDYVLDNQFAKRFSKRDGKLSRLADLHSRIQKNIIGQDEAVSKTVKALIRAKLGLRTKKRPLGNFLFLGPTGVGKTELAKVLASSFYDSNSLIRLDMSDFAEKHNVARLVGAPPGYIGYGDGGELTSKISANPNSVVLFDEIEKAHPDVLNILLQIMEEGELKDAKGQTFDFSQAVVILTSNAGTDIIHKDNIGFVVGDLDHSQLEARLKTNLKKILKPELLNRLDDVIIFKQLNKQDQLKILDLLLKDVKKALEKQDVSIALSGPVKDLLLKKGYSTEFGARSLRRIVETELLDKVAEYLLEVRYRPLSIKPKVVGNFIVI